MKEMPGAPELPEGWFYRVKSRRYGTTGAKQYTLWVYRRFLGIPIPWTWETVTDYKLGYEWDFHRSGTKPSVDDLANAAKKAMGVTKPDDVEGDYR